MHFACLPTSFSGVPVAVPPGGIGRNFANWKESVGWGVVLVCSKGMFPTTHQLKHRDSRRFSCLMLGKGGKGFRRSFSTPRWPTLCTLGRRLEAGSTVWWFDTMRKGRLHMGVSLNGGTPKTTPKWSFLVGKTMVVGYHHFRKPPYSSAHFLQKVDGFQWSD